VPPFHLTINAAADLGDIWNFIGKHSPDAADRVTEGILEACELLAKNPLMGQSLRGLGRPELRFWTLPRYRNYSIVYVPDRLPLEVVRVLHGRRNWKRILG
jgi:plasmid stabilization system protein ParE